MVIYIYRGKKGTRELGVLLAWSCRTLGDFGMRWGKYVGTVFFLWWMNMNPLETLCNDERMNFERNVDGRTLAFSAQRGSQKKMPPSLYKMWRIE